MESSFFEGFDPAGLEEWRAKVEADLRGAPFESLRTPISASTTLEPLYAKAEGVLPSEVPVRHGPWRIQPEHDDPRMEVCASAIADDLARGADALWLVAGLDHGTRVLTAGDLDAVLRAVELGEVRVQLEPEADALPVALSLVAVAEGRGVAPEQLRGGFGADPIGTLARSGSLPQGWRTARRTLGELGALAQAKYPGVRAGLVSTRPYHEAGATPPQEIAWALATGVDYVRAFLDSGLSLEAAAGQLVFSLGASDRVLETIAKLRAMRWLWFKAMAASAAGVEARRIELHVHASVARRTRRDPWVNLLRGTAEVFAAALGGADSIACAPFDAGIGPSDPFARRLSRNTQLVLRAESHLDAVDDPAAGSYALESLTASFAREAWATFREIEREGGMMRALRHGRVSAALDAERATRSRRIATRREPVLGVSEFPNLGEEPVVRDAVRLEEVEVEIGNAFGDATPEQRHEALLAFVRVLREVDAEPGRIAESALAALRLGVDVFSLGMLLRTGQASLYSEPLTAFRPAEPWEALRTRSDRFLKNHGHRPRAFLATLGPLAEHAARLTWTQNLLAAAGVEAVASAEVHDLETASAKFAANPTELAVIVCADARHADEAPEVAPVLKAKGATLVLLAGKPSPEVAEALRKRGVDDLLFAGDDVLSTLSRALRALEERS
ncbi:MAG: methylmalonyl-CoA mutase [Sandaracinus sp.]|nr:methylmalonyl-CoA mutase [Sandaracinus sp.]